MSDTVALVRMLSMFAVKATAGERTDSAGSKVDYNNFVIRFRGPGMRQSVTFRADVLAGVIACLRDDAPAFVEAASRNLEERAKLLKVIGKTTAASESDSATIITDSDIENPDAIKAKLQAAREAYLKRQADKASRSAAPAPAPAAARGVKPVAKVPAAH